VAIEKWYNMSVMRQVLNRLLVGDIPEKLGIHINDQEGKTLLFHAAESKDIELMEILIDNNIDINARDNSGKTVIDYLLEKPLSRMEDRFMNKHIVKFLVEKGGKLSEQNKRQLWQLNFSFNERIALDSWHERIEAEKERKSVGFSSKL
jgi:hypothetical protein